MEIKITRKQKLLHVGNCWCDYINYWLIHGRIINDDHTQYRKFKFVINVNFTADGYDPETGEDIPESEMMEDMIFSFTDNIKSFDDCMEFYEMCNESIMEYNGIYKANY